MFCTQTYWTDFTQQQKLTAHSLVGPNLWKKPPSLEPMLAPFHFLLLSLLSLFVLRSFPTAFLRLSFCSSDRFYTTFHSPKWSFNKGMKRVTNELGQNKINRIRTEAVPPSLSCVSPSIKLLYFTILTCLIIGKPAVKRTVPGFCLFH